MICKGFPILGLILEILLPSSWILLTYERESGCKPEGPGPHHTTKEHRTMKINSRFTKVAVAAGLVVATGAGVLGLTGFASAQVARNNTAVVASADTASGNGTTDASNLGTLQAEGSVSAESAETTSGTVTDAARPSPIADAAKALGMTEAELVTELTAGKSIADVAKAKNVDLDKVIAAITAGFKAHLDEEVKSGEHTQAEADAKLAEFKTRLDDMVNGVRPAGGREGHGGRGHGHGGPQGGQMPGAPAAPAQGSGTSAQA